MSATPTPGDGSSEPQAIANVRTPSSAAKVFQCGTCQKTYSRVDHLARHVRSHTQEKPYKCMVCSKNFSRTDLLKRHTAGHDEKPDDSNGRKRKRSSYIAGRVSQACHTCADLHLKCEEQKPCRRCRGRNIPCKVMQTVDGVKGVAAEASLLPLQGDESSSDNDLGPTTDSTEAEGTMPHDNGFDTLPTPTELDTVPGPTLHTSSTDLLSYPTLLHEPAQQLQTPDTLPSGCALLSRQAFPDCGSGTWTPRSVMDFGLQTNLELDEMDLSFLDTYNVNVPFDNQYTSEQDSSTNMTADQIYGVQSGAGIGVEAFQKSIWRYIPVPHKSAPPGDVNFSFATGDHESPARTIEVDKRATAERLPQTSRDRLLAIILSTCKPASMTRLALSFPSVELLDNLLQYYLTSPFSNASTWLHLPTFSPSNIKAPEVLTGMIAAGAVLTPDSALIKLGLAFQEALRHYVALIIEEDNSRIRELHILQAFMLQIEIGLWSGNSRKIEIAESFQQPVLTMVRRAGKFRRSSYKVIVPQPGDEGSALSSKWKAWVEQESFKRLAFHLFQHDTQASIALSTNPLVSYAEMQLPLPAPRELWLADSAAKWKMIYQSSLDTGSPFDGREGLVDCMKEVGLLNTLSSVADAGESTLHFLYGIWRMIWEYKQLYSTLRSDVYDSSLVMRSRYQDLVALLKRFRVSSDELAHGSTRRCVLILELILMHLHVSLEDIQLFAGLEGQEEALHVYPSLRDWANTSASRQAIWHAGQVIRTAKSLPLQHLRDFPAIAAYHASLTFWAYGIILNSCEFEIRRPSKQLEQQPVWLDDSETTESQRFIELGCGTPGIRGGRSSEPPQFPVAFLNNPCAVIDVVAGVLEDNHKMKDGQDLMKPLLVGNLVKLMRGLQNGMRGTHNSG